MADQNHLTILSQGADAWNNWRVSDSYRPQLRGVDFRQIDIDLMDFSEADLSGANFSGKDLTSIDLSDSDLTGANFNDANLSKTRLVSSNLFLADLVGTDLRFADLQASDFRHANLSYAKLQEAYLGGANLTGADLFEANFEGALFNATVLGNNDLSVVRGLESINHHGPSIIGIDTLFRSKGRIPKPFLVGCGVPEELITRLPSLIGAQGSKMFDSCFISYDNRDEKFVRRLYSRMIEAGVRVWFDKEDAQGGKKTLNQIKREIADHDRLLVVLSGHSLQSEWVKNEIRIAKNLEERQKSRKLFPVRLIGMDAIESWDFFDADPERDLASEVRKITIPDFSNWEHAEHFDSEFKKLLRDLQAEDMR